MLKAWRRLWLTIYVVYAPMTEENTRKRAKLDFSDFDDLEAKPKPKAPPKVQQEVAEAAGFTSRQRLTEPSQKVDGRTLRATGRTVQMNIAVKAETKNEFWVLLQDSGYARSEELLLDMMENWKTARHK